MPKRSDYTAGFDPKIASSRISQKGISESVVRYISKKNDEPKTILDFRLAALKKWQTMTEPHWAVFDYAPIDYDDIYFFAEPKKAKLTKEIKEAYRR
ncbi:MAG: Fe-S cluster assembly protein SufB, partial [Alphaproteobacteria bacterium]|nr:Fe-S cluster assembly protein SufB [Alphaproteobacteria bacterium]